MTTSLHSTECGFRGLVSTLVLEFSCDERPDRVASGTGAYLGSGFQTTPFIMVGRAGGAEWLTSRCPGRGRGER